MEEERKKISDLVRTKGIPIAYSPLYAFMEKVENYLRKNSLYVKEPLTISLQ